MNSAQTTPQPPIGGSLLAGGDPPLSAAPTFPPQDGGITPDKGSQTEPAQPANDAPAPASDEEIPFAKWGEVLENLLTSCPPLYGVLAQSQAVLKGEMLLICTDNALFKELLAQDNNKKMLAEAIRQVAGRTYRMGLRRAVTVQKVKDDPLSQLLTAARKAEVPVSED